MPRHTIRTLPAARRCLTAVALALAAARAAAAQRSAPSQAAPAAAPSGGPVRRSASAVAAPPAGATARGVVFTVADARGRALTLVGSVHLLDSTAYPLPAALDSALGAARVVAFEVDYDSAAAQVPRLMRAALLPEGQTLSARLTPGTDSLLAAVLPAVGATPAQVQRLTPWMLSLQLAGAAFQRAGLRPEFGLDRYAFTQARRGGRRVVALETAADQVGMLDGLPAADQDAMLRSTLRDFERSGPVVAALRAAWRAGDVRALDSLALGRLAAYPRTRAALFDDRNARWVPQVEALLAAGEPAAVVVGAGHLVGPRGLPALLSARGYRVTQR